MRRDGGADFQAEARWAEGVTDVSFRWRWREEGREERFIPDPFVAQKLLNTRDGGAEMDF